MGEGIPRKRVGLMSALEEAMANISYTPYTPVPESSESEKRDTTTPFTILEPEIG
ncbi:MAG: hypothetical protein FWE42_00075 [Defluviitaleaceae bacterium]|nr:hypothetical protein [Defluviitaleaceae bacterium]